MGLARHANRWVPLAVLIALVGLAPPTLDAADGPVQIKLAVDVRGLTTAARRPFTERVAQALRERLSIAGVKAFQVQVSGASTLLVETGRKVEKRWLHGLLTRRGVVEFRPHQDDSFEWVALASELPDGVELRRSDAGGDYLWSDDSASLSGLIERIALPQHRLIVVPERSNFRAMLLGPPHADLSIREARVGSGRVAHVEVAFDTSTADLDLARKVKTKVKEWVVVLDGEFVGHVAAAGKARTVYINPPSSLQRAESMGWARQVAARMAVPVPVALAVIRD